MIDVEKLRRDLDYNPETGVFVWKVSKPGIFAGTVAGKVDKSTGYMKIGFDNKLHYAHRLAWFYVHGPVSRSFAIKQKNDVRHDCRLENLYIVSQGVVRKRTWAEKRRA